MIDTALVIAAGNGIRLNCPELGLPKPLINVKGIPLIERIICTARQAGIRRFVLVTGYLGEQLREALGDGQRWSVQIEWVVNSEWERPNGLSVLYARSRLHQSFALLMADHIFQAHTLAKLLYHPLPDHGCILCVDKKIDQIYDLEDATKVRTNGNKILAVGKGLHDFNAVDTGMFLCTPALFAALESCINQGEESLSGGIRQMAKAGRIEMLDIGPALWQDVDTPGALAYAEELIQKGLV